MEKIVMYGLIAAAALVGYYAYQKYQLKEKIFTHASKYME